jgi:hypothetical protein
MRSGAAVIEGLRCPDLNVVACATLPHGVGDVGEWEQVREQCCSILLAILKYERSDEYVRAFSYFLSEEWAPDVLDVYLRATALCGQDATKFPGDYVDYAPPDKPHKDHWVCVEKAALVASLLLRPCRAELQGALLASLRLAPSATAASDKDVKRYCDAHHLESEEAPELLKLKVRLPS